MNPTFVLADAQSRLQADIMMIRLRRAEIGDESVSAVFSPRFAPNSMFLWLGHPCCLPFKSGEAPLFVSGPLQRLLGKSDTVETLPARLCEIGFDRQAADHFGQSVLLGNALLCVRAGQKNVVSIAWHIFRHSGAEVIAVSGTPSIRTAAEPSEELRAASWSPAFAA